MMDNSTSLVVFFCKHKTAYEMRISDWSSDVCSSDLHERLAARGACFGEAAGWERASWFLPQDASARGEQPEYRYSWGRQNWFDHAAAEHQAVREGVGLFDHTSFAQFRVEGRDAEAVDRKSARWGTTVSVRVAL